MLREGGGGRGNAGASNMGVSGLKALGVKDLTYKTAFLACMAQSAEARVSLKVCTRARDESLRGFFSLARSPTLLISVQMEKEAHRKTLAKSSCSHLPLKSLIS